MARPVCRCHAAPDGGLWTCTVCQQLFHQLPLGSRRRPLGMTPQTPRRKYNKKKNPLTLWRRSGREFTLHLQFSPLKVDRSSFDSVNNWLDLLLALMVDFRKYVRQTEYQY